MVVTSPINNALTWVVAGALSALTLTPAWGQSSEAAYLGAVAASFEPTGSCGSRKSCSKTDEFPDDAGPRYWIFFVDRGVEDLISRFAATPEARMRRARRGTVAPATIDYHVSPRHVAALQKLGVRPLVESRWMNAVSAVLSEDQRRAVGELDVVSHILPIARYRPARVTDADAASTVPFDALAGPLAAPYSAADGPTVRMSRASNGEISTMSAPSLAGFRTETARSSKQVASNYGAGEQVERNYGAARAQVTLSYGAARAQMALDYDGSGDRVALDYGASKEQLALVNAIGPLEEGINGAGVRLGFLDASFAEFEHPSLDHLRLDNRVQFMDFAGAQGGSHGLSVVSVAAGFAPGELIGPAYGADILGATTEYVPSETNIEEDYFVAGLEWLEAMGADVVNASIGYTTFDAGERSYTPDDLDGDTGIATRAADRAASLGIVFVAAAGNNGCDSPVECWYYVGTPADGDSVVTVGGVTQTSIRSTFSSQGPTADGRTKPDVAALASGVYIGIPGGAYAYSGGTSFASPMVAGIVAQMLQANPSLRPMEVLDILRQTASQSDNPDNALGWGIVDAAAAVQIAMDLGSEQSSPLVARAYPNPATDYLFIHINARSLHRPDIHVYDVLGRSVDAQSAGVRYPSRDLISLSTARLAPGVYFYVVEADEMRASGRFVVVR